MSRTTAVAFAVLLAVNAVVGVAALTRTLRLGQASQQASQRASSTLVAKRTAQLDRFEASLRAQLAKKPPPLPKKPSPATYASSAPAAPPAVAGAPQVRYVRPAPIIVQKHRPGSEQEGGDAADEGGGSDD
jgi:beta-phosphoglucomutase-like phosphatase (HAD superfamily)